jgi:hypothetical protein
VGDRGSIRIHEGDGPSVYLYTHWTGSELPHIVRRALASPAGRNRWNDAPYLTRIIFDELTRGEQGGEMGYGIWSTPLETTVVDVNVKTQKVTLSGTGARLSFREYVNANTMLGG